MSGGIDSTAACKILQSQGYEVVGLTLLTCERSLPACEEAAALAARFNIRHHIADIRGEFKESVIEPFLQAYLAGLTPNPCIDCNPTVKFRTLTEYADKLGCKYIATGHYVRTLHSDGKVFIRQGADNKKDQSYFLWRLSQEQLRRTLFPLGEMTKEEARKLLKEEGLTEKSNDGESMEICFFDGDYRDYLHSAIPDADSIIKPGYFVDSEGRKLGEHKGYPYYTIGQRKGLNIALGHPAYVLKINAAKNTVMLGEAEQLLTRHMIVESPSWVDGVPSAGISARIRHRSKSAPCRIERSLPDGKWLVCFDEPVSAVTPGQSAVFYRDDIVVGGAYISSQRGINQWINSNDGQQ